MRSLGYSSRSVFSRWCVSSSTSCSNGDGGASSSASNCIRSCLTGLGPHANLENFYQLEAGERFLAGLSPERPHERIISAVRGGVVFAVLGVTMVIAAYVGALGDEREDLLIVAIVLTGLGAGLLLAAAASFMIARRFGVVAASRNKETPVA